jgi:hypothetical protein
MGHEREREQAPEEDAARDYVRHFLVQDNVANDETRLAGTSHESTHGVVTVL